MPNEHPDSNLFLQKALAVATFAFDSINKNVMTSSTTGSFTLHEVPPQSLGACFSKVLIINASGKLLLFTFKIKVSIVLQIT